MGNFIKTKSGIDISLDIPAQITSFETNEQDKTSTHVTRGKLKVFSIGKTGDYRVFTKEFAQTLVESLPGTPVVAFYDDETDDFKGHNDEQYVYGYVPEDTVPEFVEDEDGKTWAVVDVNLFTERQDKIGEIANKIIGKAQSLELNPDTVDWELVYINNRLEKIIFKKGSFYGLSVLGDDQTPAFKGAGFFTSDVIEQIKTFKSSLTKDGGDLEMNKMDFLSLGCNQKLRQFETIIQDKKWFDYIWVTDFTEEDVYFYAYNEDYEHCKLFGASYKWNGGDSYEIGDFYEAIPTYAKKEDVSSNPSSFETKEEKNGDNVGDSVDEVVEETVVDSAEGNQGEPAQANASDDGADNSADEGAANDAVEGDNAGEGDASGDAAGEAAGDAASMSLSQKEERDSDEPQEENSEEEKEANNCEEIPTNASSLSDEERDELNSLRREKKLSLISNYETYLSEEALKELISNVDKYDLDSLEKELKIQSFDANKEKFQEKEQGTFGIVLPTVDKNNCVNTLDRLVAENI